LKKTSSELLCTRHGRFMLPWNNRKKGFKKMQEIEIP
jgi:hypothetical protein